MEHRSAGFESDLTALSTNPITPCKAENTPVFGILACKSYFFQHKVLKNARGGQDLTHLLPNVTRSFRTLCAVLADTDSLLSRLHKVQQGLLCICRSQDLKGDLARLNGFRCICGIGAEYKQDLRKGRIGSDTQQPP